MTSAMIKNSGLSPGRHKETRAAILAAAARIFAKSGLAGARTDAIAAAAGVNKALLYYYFDSKEALYEAVLEDQFTEFNHKAIEVLSAPGPARAALLRYVNMHLDFITERRQFAPLFQQVVMSGSKFLQRLIRQNFAPRGEALRKLIERGARNGEFRRVDPFHASLSIVALIVFYFTTAPVFKMLGMRDAYSAANLKRRKLEVIDLIRHGLFAQANSKSVL
jgi:TetR/AcrR family transcriptional regulator